jgi:hypothetical protein
MSSNFSTTTSNVDVVLKMRCGHGKSIRNMAMKSWLTSERAVSDWEWHRPLNFSHSFTVEI